MKYIRLTEQELEAKKSIVVENIAADRKQPYIVVGGFIKEGANHSKQYNANICCEQCSGKGLIPHFAYNDNGICYKCLGTGYEQIVVTLITDEHRSKLNAEKEAKKQEGIEYNNRFGFKEIDFKVKDWFWKSNSEIGRYLREESVFHYSVLKETEKAVLILFISKYWLEEGSKASFQNSMWIPKAAIVRG